MELTILLSCLFLIYANFVEQISIASPLEHRIGFIMCLSALLLPIVSQLIDRRFKKTPFIKFIIGIGIFGFVFIAASLFIENTAEYSMINQILHIDDTVFAWGLFLTALALQNCSILYHGMKNPVNLFILLKSWFRPLAMTVCGILTVRREMFSPSGERLSHRSVRTPLPKARSRCGRNMADGLQVDPYLTKRTIFKEGLFLLLLGIIVEYFAIIMLIKYDLFIASGSGILGHAITLIGCFIMRKSATPPKTNLS